MKKTLDEWRALIRTELTEKGPDRYYTAFCPICGRDEPGTSIGSDAGKYAARGKIASHIELDHKDCLAFDYLGEAKAAMERSHKCKASHVETVPVLEVFQGKTAWEGEVEVFDLVGHPKTKRAYAWGYANEERGGKLDFVTVLEIPPVNSPQTAVKAVIVATAKSGGSLPGAMHRNRPAQ